MSQRCAYCKPLTLAKSNAGRELGRVGVLALISAPAGFVAQRRATKPRTIPASASHVSVSVHIQFLLNPDSGSEALIALLVHLPSTSHDKHQASQAPARVRLCMRAKPCRAEHLRPGRRRFSSVPQTLQICYFSRLTIDGLCAPGLFVPCCTSASAIVQDLETRHVRCCASLSSGRGCRMP